MQPPEWRSRVPRVTSDHSQLHWITLGYFKCLTESISHQTYGEKVQNLARQPDVLHTIGQTLSTKGETSGSFKYYLTDIMKENTAVNCSFKRKKRKQGYF